MPICERHRTHIGVSLDLYCLNCEQFTVVIITPMDKAITQIKCSACKELMVLVQIVNNRLAEQVYAEFEVKE